MGGMFSWLLGPRSQPQSRGMLGYEYTARVTRNLLLDVDTLVDLRDELAGMLPVIGGRFDGAKPVVAEYRIDRGVINADELAGLHVADKQQLSATYRYATLDSGGESRPQLVQVSSRGALINVSDQATAQAISSVVTDFLYRHGQQEINWQRVRVVTPLLFPLVVLASYVWLIVTVSLPVAAHVLLISLVVCVWAGAIVFIRYLRERRVFTYRLRYRGESRATTVARRADERTNLKVAVITAVLTLIGGILLALALGWLNLDGDSQAPSPVISQTP